MNEFEQNPQEQKGDMPANILGIVFSLGFFLTIFTIGVIISLIDW